MTDKRQCLAPVSTRARGSSRLRGKESGAAQHSLDALPLRCLSARKLLAGLSREGLPSDVMRGMRGAERSHALLSGRPSGAPLRRYFNAHAATPYLCFRSRANGASPELTWASHPRRPRVRTPEAGRYPYARSAGVVATLGVRAHLRRRIPSPHDRDGLGHASLTGKGWRNHNRAVACGDKVCSVIPAQAGIQMQQALSVRPWTPAFAGVTTS